MIFPIYGTIKNAPNHEPVMTCNDPIYQTWCKQNISSRGPWRPLAAAPSSDPVSAPMATVKTWRLPWLCKTNGFDMIWHDSKFNYSNFQIITLADLTARVWVNMTVKQNNHRKVIEKFIISIATNTGEADCAHWGSRLCHPCWPKRHSLR